MKSDRQIQQDVIEELKFDPGVHAESIGVSVNEGVVTLGGFVPSYSEKYAAEKAAFRVSGVISVAEEIDVKLSDDKRRTDADLAKAAVNALKWNVWVPALVKVTVEDAVVGLRGSVRWEFQREAAYVAVRDLVGVQAILNRIEVKSEMKPGDIKKAIEDALLRCAAENARNIQVSVEDGRVLLDGKVHSRSEIEDAKRAAWCIPGVENVESRLRIS